MLGFFKALVGVSDSVELDEQPADETETLSVPTKKPFQPPYPPESLFDDVPSMLSEDIQRTRFDTFGFSDSDGLDCPRSLLQVIRENHFAIIRLTEQQQQFIHHLFNITSNFFKLPYEDKFNHRSWKSGHPNGYERIHFPNVDNIREEEFRDAFSILTGYLRGTPWPSHEFDQAVRAALALLY